MDKKSFLEELNKYLEVLDPNEQNDILDEYSQHIDLKIANGLSEEDAIKDFGSISELATGILAAYHVNPQYSHVKKFSFSKAAKHTKEKLKSIVSGIKAPHFNIHGFFSKIKSALKAIPAFFKKVFSKIKLRKPKVETTQPKPIVEKKKAYSFGFFKKCSSLIKTLWNFFFRCCCWCIRWTYNLFLIGTGGIFAMMCLGSLLLLGTSVVWFLSGYPFIGITLCLFGSVLVFGCVAILLFSLVKIKKKNSIENNSESSQTIKEEIHHA